ncbi:hypothetical protein V9T40_012554 [Parthenolecanium corni]|uniref:Uncharacterized protein n=1 Tax=Parthenolecanium corni TaxID=536013 RepID=A0AAN9T7G8_9HEMI
MDNAKKMILVPPEYFNRMNESKPVIQTPAENIVDGSSLSQLSYVKTPTNDLDSEMNQILNKTNLNDREKWSQYYQILQRYFHQNKIQRQPVELSINETSTMGNTIPDRDIISTYPASMQKNAERLLNWIKRSNAHISWDENGIVKIKGYVINGSNIIDLIGDLMRPRKTANPPIGISTFIQTLRETNVPEELIGNKDRLQQVKRMDTRAGGPNMSDRTLKKRKIELTPSPILFPNLDDIHTPKQRADYLRSLKKNRKIKGGWETLSD